MEGYGPIATGMGGASMAYDNGTAAMINNPSTLGLMKSGTQRFDIAIGGLHPKVGVGVSVPGMGSFGSSDSSGDAYYMPAIGYVRKDGNLTWGAGMMSQGGMGTEWGRTSVLSSGGFSSLGAMFGPTNQEQRSELGFGRLLFPLSYDFSPNFRVGGSIDYVWGGLDVMMTVDGNMFAAMAGNMNNANKRAIGYVNGNSSMLASLGPLAAAGLDYAHISASEGTNKFQQELTTNGWAGNIGFQWQATPQFAVGAVYHARTNLDDMAGSATMTIQCTAATCPGMPTKQFAMRGNLRVINFQWPETIAVGMSYQASDKWLLAADYKNIQWSKVMQKFAMRFDSGGQFIDFGLNQNWDDQNVFQFGASYKFDEALTLRIGANLADNPIPDGNLNPLFPATVTNHYTFGAGYGLSKSSAIDFSLTIAPEVSATNPGKAAATAPFTAAPIPAISTSHGQTNWQLMYSNKF